MNYLMRLHELASRSQRQVDRQEVLSNASGVAGAGLVGAGGVAAYRAINPTVGITYGKTNAYRGHLSHAEDVKKILDGAGVKSSMHNANTRGFFGSQRHAVMVNTGFGPNVVGASRVKFKPDYTAVTDSVLPVMPDAMSKPIKSRKRTAGVYGGGGGVDVGAKVPHLAKAHEDFDAIHLYAGPKSKNIKPGYAGGGYEEAQAAVAELAKTNPAAAAKFKVHSSMSRKAIKNAVRAHSVNIGNAGAGTMHEVAASPKPGVIWQASPYASNHFKVNEALAHRYGMRVARGANDIARNEDAVAHLRHIARDSTRAVERQKESAEQMIRDGAKSRSAFVDDVKSALNKSRRRNVMAAAGLGGVGLLLGANAIRSRNSKTKNKP
jgi:hypothetical protein